MTAAAVLTAIVAALDAAGIPAMRADVYLAGADALQVWALQHRVVRTVEGEAVQFAPIEYVIVYKLRFFQASGSDRHLRDIARMMEVSGAEVWISAPSGPRLVATKVASHDIACR